MLKTKNICLFPAEKKASGLTKELGSSYTIYNVFNVMAVYFSHMHCVEMLPK